MRWGVGKGRFRNLTAVFLCILLAATFYAVWTFFQRIKPLTIDTSPLALTAGVSERLLNTSTYTSDTLGVAQMMLFCRIADSLESVVRRDIAALRSKNKKLSQASILTLLADMQENVRRTVGIMLNETYTSVSEYRFIERKVLAAFNALDVNTEESATEREIIEHPAVEAAQKQLAVLIDTTQLRPHEKEIVQEFVPHLRSKLFAFAIGLSSDDIRFIEMNEQQKAQQEAQPTNGKKEKKGDADAR